MISPSSTPARGRPSFGRVAIALTAACAAAFPILSASAQAPGMTVSSFTADQATRGRTAYTDNCSGCHGTTLGGEGEAPSLIGTGFRTRWFGETADIFFTYISTSMPQQAPGSLDAQTYADIMAFIMDRNRIPAGNTELPADLDALSKIELPEPQA